MNIRHLHIFFILFYGIVSIFGQAEILTNTQIIEMSKIGLDVQIIQKKIRDTPNNFDVSVNALIDLKKAGVAAEVIALMMEKTDGKILKSSENKTLPTTPTDDSKGFSDSVPVSGQNQFPTDISDARQSLLTARTIAIEKSSLHPSRQALEKELLKRPEWKKFNLSLVRYKESADLYIEIGRVPLSLITHRYTFRVYDRRNGMVIAAGETTSWGSLAENMAREIAKKLSAVATNQSR